MFYFLDFENLKFEIIARNGKKYIFNFQTVLKIYVYCMWPFLEELHHNHSHKDSRFKADKGFKVDEYELYIRSSFLIRMVIIV